MMESGTMDLIKVFVKRHPLMALLPTVNCIDYVPLPASPSSAASHAQDQ